MRPFGMWTFKIEREHLQTQIPLEMIKGTFPKYRPFCLTYLMYFCKLKNMIYSLGLVKTWRASLKELHITVLKALV